MVAGWHATLVLIVAVTFWTWGRRAERAAHRVMQDALEFAAARGELDGARHREMVDG